MQSVLPKAKQEMNVMFGLFGKKEEAARELLKQDPQLTAPDSRRLQSRNY